MPHDIQALLDRPPAKPVAAPGSEFPEVAFDPKRVKVTIVATFEVRNETDIETAKGTLAAALKALNGYAEVGPNISTHYERL